MTGLVEGLLTPSKRDEGAYEFFLIGFAHMGLGVALCQLLGLPTTMALFIAKEALWDVWRGGRLPDCLLDILFVFSGAGFFLFEVMGWVWLATAAAITVIREHIRRI